MRYLCLIYLGDAERDTLAGRECGELAPDAFRVVQPAATLVVRGGEISIVDGPASQALRSRSEAPGSLAGVCLIEARDLNDAVRIVAKTPAASAGCVEIRLIQELDLPEKTQDPP